MAMEGGLPTLGTLRSKLLAVGLLVLLIGLVVRSLGIPLVEHYRRNLEALHSQRYQLAKYQAVAGTLADRGEALERARGADQVSIYALTQGSPALAAAALQETVKGLVVENGGKLTSVRVLPTKLDEDFQRVSVNVRATLENEALQNVLYALESDAPYLLVDNLTITSRQRGRSARRARRRARATTPVARTELDVTFDLSGLLKTQSRS